MKEVKIYTIVSDQLSPPITGESFCTDMVRHSDYAGLEAKCAALVAENAALQNPDNWLSQSDYGYEAAEVATQNGATEGESLRAGMIAIINRIETPATETILAEVRSEVIGWLDVEISAIDPVYRGDPSYEHDAYWMKNEVRDLVESAKKVFACQQSHQEAA